MSGPLFPRAGNNANLLGKILRNLQEQHSVRFLSFADKTDRAKLPESFFGAPIQWCLDERSDFMRRFVYPIISMLTDRHGFSDALQGRLLLDEAGRYRGEYPYDVVISTMEPFPCADASSHLKSVKRFLYLMDPPAIISNGRSTPYRTRRLRKLLAAQDAILTTPFIRQALLEHGYVDCAKRIVPVGFPLIEQHNTVQQRQEDGRIHLLFCGWLYSDIRSPKYFLDILSQLDKRFVVTFMGRECEKVTERFNIQTKAELITLPQQPYEVALHAMADADIMINIGNSVPVHMPSKTLEYINTGKPFVNFYKMDDCPTLYYTKRYPLCLNISEQDPNLDTAAERFVEFCIQNKGKAVDRDFIEREYEDCTPQYIAKIILDALGE